MVIDGRRDGAEEGSFVSRREAEEERDTEEVAHCLRTELAAGQAPYEGV